MTRQNRIFIEIGGLFFALSTVLPWIHVILLGNLNLFQLASADHAIRFLPDGIFSAGSALTVGARFKRFDRIIPWGAAATVHVSLIAGGIDLFQLLRAIDRTAGLVSAGPGILAVITALVLLGIGSTKTIIQRITITHSP